MSRRRTDGPTQESIELEAALDDLAELLSPAPRSSGDVTRAWRPWDLDNDSPA